MDSSQLNSGRPKQTDDEAATSMHSSQPKRGRGQPKQTDDEAATSRERQRQKRKEREAAQKSEGGTAYEQRRSTALQKKKEHEAAKRCLPLKEEVPANQGHAAEQFCLGVAYEDGRGWSKVTRGPYSGTDRPRIKDMQLHSFK